MTNISSISSSLQPLWPTSIPVSAGQTQTADSPDATPQGGMTLTMAPAQAPDITKTDLYKQWQADAAVSQDTNALTDAVTAAFTAILKQRPDLADAKFDFVSDNGKIAVVSNELSDDDRQWLEQQLNADTALLGAIGTFNTDLSTAAAARAAVNDPDGAAAPSSNMGGSVHYLALLQGIANTAGQTGWLNDATYADDQGKPIDLASARTTSLAGMIDTKRQMDALQQGTIVTTLGNGRVIYQSERNPNLYQPAAIMAEAQNPASGATLQSGSPPKGTLVDQWA